MKITQIIKVKSIILILLILSIGATAFYVWNFLDIGINSSFQAKSDFTSSFKARQTGNCDEFVKWVSDEFNEGWKNRCIEEKNRNHAAIVSFEIQNIQVSGDKAFLLVELQRSNIIKQKIEPYSVNYELIRYRKGWSSWWLLNQSIK